MERFSLIFCTVIAFEIEAVDRIKSIELLRNSEVIQRIDAGTDLVQKGTFIDTSLDKTSKVLYYYLRVIQENDHIGWSSPVWVERG